MKWKLNVPKKKQKRYYSGKQKCHTIKSQLLVEFETGKIIATAVEKGKTHDFKLLKLRRLPFVQSQLCLADRGYQGLAKLHKSACTPTKKPRKQALPDAEKQHNRALARLRVRALACDSPLQDFPPLFWALPQSQKAVWFTFKSDCWAAQLRTGTGLIDSCRRSIE